MRRLSARIKFSLTRLTDLDGLNVCETSDKLDDCSRKARIEILEQDRTRPAEEVSKEGRQARFVQFTTEGWDCGIASTA